MQQNYLPFRPILPVKGDNDSLLEDIPSFQSSFIILFSVHERAIFVEDSHCQIEHIEEVYVSLDLEFSFLLVSLFCLPCSKQEDGDRSREGRR